MRLDDFLSTIGVIKRRTEAKEMADSGLIKINGARSKPSHQVKIGDIISIGGGKSITIEVKEIPIGNVRKDTREKYYSVID